VRRVILILVVLGLLAGAIVAWLAVTTPKTVAGVRFPLRDSHRALLARVPASADAFALIPTAAALHGELLANPVTAGPIQEWTDKQGRLPSPWMLGGADVVIWKEGKATSYAIRLDPVRALLVRFSLMVGGGPDVRWEGSTLILSPSVTPGMGEAAMVPLLVPGQGLPAGDALAVQVSRDSGGFPPLERPTVSMVAVDAKELLITSRGPAPATPAVVTEPQPPATFPRGAILSASFTEPPRVIGDLNRLVGGGISGMLDGGGSIAIYDVDTGTLLPRPKGVIAAPSSPEGIGRLSELANIFGETREVGGQTLVAFDRTSMSLYIKDTFVPADWPANRWALRIDPKRMVPILEDLADSQGLRYATPRIHRSARDLRRWIGALREAQSIEAADSVMGNVEELRVRISSP
jgi:hypothetical protein